jgi:D-alanine-D-alanine ligase
MIAVDPAWWQTLFDEVYLVTDAPFVCNPALTSSEVDRLERVLSLYPTLRILDCCGGQGCHALELAWRGYRPPVVVDYSTVLLQHGRRTATSAGLAVPFCQGDARVLPFPSASFDIVLVLGNAFGYGIEVSEDRRVLTEVARVLPSGGRVVLDLIDREAALRHFRTTSWHDATADIVVCWQRELVQEVIRVREVVLSKTTGLVRDRTYAERLYTPEDLRALLVGVGCGDIVIHHGALVYTPDEEQDDGLATTRMLVVATKRCTV